MDSTTPSDIVSVLSRLLDMWPTEKEREHICRKLLNHATPHCFIDEISISLDKRSPKTPHAMLFGEHVVVTNNPVLLARQMLSVSLYLLHLPPHLNEGILEKPSKEIGISLASVASLGCNDELASLPPTIEAIQWHVLERKFFTHIGWFDEALRLSHEAITASASLSLKDGGPHRDVSSSRHHRSTQYEAGYLWNYVVQGHLTLCLSTGHGNIEGILTQPNWDEPDPVAQYKGYQCFVAHKILLHHTTKDPMTYDMAVSYNDKLHDLRSRTNSEHQDVLPRYMASDYAGLDADVTSCVRLYCMQATDHYIVLHLFAAYMLKQKTRLPLTIKSGHRRTISVVRCVEAAREILRRFHLLTECEINRVDFGHSITLMAYHAAIVLLLAHAECNCYPELREQPILANANKCEQDFRSIRSVCRMGLELNKRWPSQDCENARQPLRDLILLDLPHLPSRTSLYRLDRDDTNSQDDKLVVVKLPHIDTFRVRQGDPRS